jgi:hypothetical protein
VHRPTARKGVVEIESERIFSKQKSVQNGHSGPYTLRTALSSAAFPAARRLAAQSSASSAILALTATACTRAIATENGKPVALARRLGKHGKISRIGGLPAPLNRIVPLDVINPKGIAVRIALGLWGCFCPSIPPPPL